MGLISDNKKCSECFCSKWIEGNNLLESGYKCYLNPFRAVTMGILGEHSRRNENIQNQKDIK